MIAACRNAKHVGSDTLTCATRVTVGDAVGGETIRILFYPCVLFSFFISVFLSFLFSISFLPSLFFLGLEESTCSPLGRTQPPHGRCQGLLTGSAIPSGTGRNGQKIMMNWADGLGVHIPICPVLPARTCHGAPSGGVPHHHYCQKKHKCQVSVPGLFFGIRPGTSLHCRQLRSFQLQFALTKH